MADAHLCAPRKSFPFPFKPYDIQLALMTNIYTALKKKRIGIFESPTGTGKTLSVISSAMTWLREHQEFGSDDEQESPSTKSSNALAAASKAQAPRSASAIEDLDWISGYEEQKASREKSTRLSAHKALRADLETRLAKIRLEDDRAGGGGSAHAKLSKEERRKRMRQAMAGKRRREKEEDGGGAGAGGGASTEGSKRGGASNSSSSTANADAEGDPNLVDEYYSSDDADAEGSSSSSSSADRRRASAAGPATGAGAGSSRGGVSTGTSSLADQIRAELESSKKATAAKSSSSGGGAQEDTDAEAFRPKLFYVSRTHSQVSQFIREIHKTPFGKDARVVALGARKNLCVNPDVLALNSDTRINERCAELQDSARTVNEPAPAAAAAAADAEAPAAKRHKTEHGVEGRGHHSDSLLGPSSSAAAQVAASSSTGSSIVKRKVGGCPFLDPAGLDALHDRLLASIHDVENAAEVGMEHETCAYYASRAAVREAEVVAMPYTLLLNARTRDSTGITPHLKGSVVIIDEAHNIIDAINQSHAARATVEQLVAAESIVRAYLDKYRSRMKGSNVTHCTQLADAMGLLAKYLLHGPAGQSAAVPVAAPTSAAVAADEGHHAPAAAAAVVTVPVPVAAAPAPKPAAPFGGFFTPPSRPLSPAVDLSTAATVRTDRTASLSNVRPPSRSGSPGPGATSSGISSGASSGSALSGTSLVPKPGLPPKVVHTVSELLLAMRADHINVFKIQRYVEAVHLMRKLRGFAEAGARATAAPEVVIHARGGNNNKGGTMKDARRRSVDSGDEHDSSTAAASDAEEGGGASSKEHKQSYMAAVSALQQAYAFLCTLMNGDADGRVIVDRSPEGGGSAHYKFVLLNPAVPFREVVDAARSVVLVGGTMQPISDVVQQLFGHVPASRVTTFSCGHIIPRESLAGLTVARAPDGQLLDFRHQARRNPAMMEALGRALVGLSCIVPAGMVVFLPSYDYERVLLQAWAKGSGGATAPAAAHHAAARSTSASPSFVPSAADTTTNGGIPPYAAGSILDQLSRRKKLFAEPRAAAEVDTVLAAYTAAATRQTMPPTAAAATAGAHVIGAHRSGRSSAASWSSRSSASGDDDDSSDREGGGGDSDAGSLSDASIASARGSGSLLAKSNSLSTGGVGSHTSGSSFRPLSAATTDASGSSSSSSSLTGALLFSVVGGKMSEGINFSDDLARAVVVVGLPFPNPSDAELKERLAYLDAKAAGGAGGAAATGSSEPTAGGRVAAGKDYYENLCMRAVNQSIGRSIRHAGDHAVILLLDHRYASPRIRSKLPGWIADRMSDHAVWSTVAATVGGFFRHKREQHAGASAATATTAAAAAATAATASAPTHLHDGASGANSAAHVQHHSNKQTGHGHSMAGPSAFRSVPRSSSLQV